MSHPVSQEEWSKYWDKAYGYFFRRLSNASSIEDLVTEVLHAFFLNDKQIDFPEAFFWSIVRNKFLAHLKSKSNKANQIITLDKSNESNTNPDPSNFVRNPNTDLDDYDPFYEQKIQRLLKCVHSQLSDQDVTIVEMSIMCDFGSQRVAEELEMTSGNVRVRLTRALSKLREKCRRIWE